MISIIMPFKNSATFIEGCIQSIQKQTELNWELIAIDDHSTDESFNIVSSYAKLDARIKLFTNKGDGIIDGLNTAYNISMGEYVTRIDSDDKVPPHRLETHLKLLKKHGLGHIATGKVAYFSETSIGLGYQSYQNWINGLIDQNSHWDEVFKECVIPSPCWMMHRIDFDRCGAFIGDDYPEDYDLVFRTWQQGIKVVSSSDVLLHWREHPNRTSRNDERLTDWYFSKLKVKYFLRNVYKLGNQVVIWGVGNRAKDLVKLLNKHNIPLLLLSANPNKIGKSIDTHKIIGLDAISYGGNLQHIITFTNIKSKNEVSDYMKRNGMKLNSDYFFFA